MVALPDGSKQAVIPCRSAYGPLEAGFDGKAGIARLGKGTPNRLLSHVVPLFVIGHPQFNWFDLRLHAKFWDAQRDSPTNAWDRTEMVPARFADASPADGGRFQRSPRPDRLGTTASWLSQRGPSLPQAAPSLQIRRAGRRNRG